MPLDEETQRKMDEAAAQAQDELQEHFNSWSAQDMITWWRKWYTKAGHKRLGRVLVAMGRTKTT
jgi:hypothetical protein